MLESIGELNLASYGTFKGLPLLKCFLLVVSPDGHMKLTRWICETVRLACQVTKAHLNSTHNIMVSALLRSAVNEVVSS